MTSMAGIQKIFLAVPLFLVRTAPAASSVVTNTTCVIDGLNPIPCGYNPSNGRTISCSCPAGLCCSRFGYCGPNPTRTPLEDSYQYCGSGCQTSYSFACQLNDGQVCPPELRTPCNANPSTAEVLSANKIGSKYTCRSYCSDGCCYIFNPHNRLDRSSGAAIAGWTLLAVAAALCIICLLPPIQTWYAIYYLKTELHCLQTLSRTYSRAAALAPATWTWPYLALNWPYLAWPSPVLPAFAMADFTANFPTVAPNGPFPNGPFNRLGDVSALNEYLLNGRKKIRKVAFAFLSIGASFAATCLLYGTNHIREQQSGLNIASIILPICIYIWVTSGLAVLLVFFHIVFQRKCDYDISTSAAGAIGALVLLSFMPVIGGYDGVSGIAFTDRQPTDQGFLLNQTRYTALVNGSNAIFSVAVGLLLFAQSNMIVGLMT